ncbi:putative phage abortive infection protein [Aquimarina algiphila]|uniref:putative phage abortive infection protein n=1 Tax=Aquimarina algiphila TaxID=2047982 RepID=UPI00232FF820|nr:putative phage abortive infection protein [Aquimarina algiphila]
MKLLPDNIEQDKYLGKGNEYLYFSLVTIIIILVSIFLASFFEEIDLGDLGSILSGTLGPVIALLVAIFTFLAFYVQYDANKKIQLQFKVQQFESQFYKMLDLHKSNIEEMNVTFFDHITEESFTKDLNGKISSAYLLKSTEFLREIEGRKLFHGMIKELETVIDVVLDETNIYIGRDIRSYPNMYSYLLGYSYKLFWFGLDSEQARMRGNLALEEVIISKLLRIQKKFYERHKLGIQDRQDPVQFRFYPFEGHESRLSHYFRNLFAIVRLVVENYDGDYNSKSYTIARKYLKILRAQLSNSEQHLLYYNYRIGFGVEWDQNGIRNNKFFTKYRMIHNLPVDRIKIPESPRVHFADYIKSDEVSVNDPLFEWGDN